MKYNCKKLSVLFAAVMMFVLACPVTVLAAAEEEAGTPAVYATFWSLIPPVVAIVLALITKEVYSSLFLGILVGALLYSGGNFEGTVNHIFSSGMISVLSSSSNVGILVFLVILGTMVCLYEPGWRISRFWPLGRQTHQDKSWGRAGNHFTWSADFH